MINQVIYRIQDSYMHLIGNEKFNLNSQAIYNNHQDHF